MAKAKVSAAQALRLRKVLEGNGFVSARALESIGFERRTIRLLCETFPTQFFSTQKGYKLVCEARKEELENSVNDLRSRARHITRRADALETMIK